MGLLDSFLKGVSKGAELDGGPEQRLANAYSLMSQNLQRDEEDQETQYYDNLMAAAGDGKERSIEDYQKILDERQKSGAKPTTGRTETPSWMRAYEGPTPIQRWKKQIDAMIQSGNPDLQKQGLDLIASYQQRATQAPVIKDPKRSSSAQIAIDLGLRPGTAEFNNFVKQHAMKASTTIDMGSRGSYLTKAEKLEGGLDPEGAFVWTQDGPKPVKQTPYTEGQLKAAGFADRMEKAEQTISSLDEKGFDPTTLQQLVAENVPFLGSYIASGPQQVHIQAQRDWVRAKLRQESGATIGDQEMQSEIETYFPQPGDKPEVIHAKDYARKIAIDAMARSSGGKYKTKDVRAAEQAVKDAESGASANDGIDYGDD